MYTRMGSKNVSIQEDTYERLKLRKRDDESFTDLFERLLDSRTDLTAGFGAWADDDAPEHADAVREELDADLERGVEAFRRARQDEDG